MLSFRIAIHLTLASLACALLQPAAWAGKVTTTMLQVLISANETRGASGSAWTYAESLDGQWAWQGKHTGLEFTVDSDYSRSDTAITDHLLNSLRWIGARDPNAQGWKPVFLAQTEGDHSFDSAMLLLALGMRRQYRYGFIEFTGGSSRNIGFEDSWVGDVGLAFSYERTFAKRWKLHTGPKAQYGTMGELRLRDDRLRYSWDLNLDYQIAKACSLGYRLWTGNTAGDTERTQWIGLNFKVK